MNTHLIVDTSRGELYYHFFYLLGFLAAYLIILREGYKRGFPMLEWIIMLVCIRFFVITGTKLFSFSQSDWVKMVHDHILIQNNEKTMFGGLLMGVAGYFIARYFLKFRYPVWDTVAIAFPVAVSIQTIGCFFYGCCFGAPSDLPWAVQYPVMTLAHYHQFQSGMLSYQDLYSMPVHPVQLYECLGGILVTVLVIALRRRWKAQGSLLLSSIIIFSIVRMVIEFFRDPASNKTGGDMLLILKEVQWLYLGVAFTATLILLWREKKYHYTLRKVIKSANPGLIIKVTFLLSLIFMILVLRNWYTLPEIIALNMALLPAVALTGIEIFNITAVTRNRWIYLCSLLLPLFLMSQTIQKPQIEQSGEKNLKTYHTIGVGYATGNYTDYRMNYSGSGCDRIANQEYFSQKYSSFAAGYSYTTINKENQSLVRYGSDVFIGKYSQFRQSDSSRYKTTLWGIGPYVKYDAKWFGIGGGVHLGNLVYTTGDLRKKFDSNPPMPGRGYLKTIIMPRFDLRIGVERFFFGDFHLADQFPVSSPGLAFQAGVGSGFGIKNGMKLRTGFSFLEHNGLYVSVYLPIEDRIVIESLFLWTGKYEKELYSIKLPENQFSIGLSYRFGHK